ncbi:MAG: TlyA family RNA methyltransferase [Deltaproteobacteria bacterium]|nr:TlyA family RNA methyltransferase [Deltaproteobacteria bacterium]
MRLDALLVKLGLAASRARARALIEEGQVLVDTVPALKVATQVRADQAIALKEEDHSWVGRGALKLLGALEAFPQDLGGAVAADFGASTGGFTQVLLSRGAARVYAIDVGKGQLDWGLRQDPRVVVMEGVNARYLESLPEPVSLVVGDLSFISLELILPAVARVLGPRGRVLILVKPQFEVGRESLGKKGLVRSEEARSAAIARVRHVAADSGFLVLGGADAAVAGAKSGNLEHFLYLELGPEGR